MLGMLVEAATADQLVMMFDDPVAIALLLLFMLTDREGQKNGDPDGTAVDQGSEEEWCGLGDQDDRQRDSKPKEPGWPDWTSDRASVQLSRKGVDLSMVGESRGAKVVRRTF
ncbi:MAG: hypothetical protein RLZZ511_1019 [Cyanobacteriota bacterium]